MKLKAGILASNIVYVSISHTNKVLNIYFKELEKIFYNLSTFSSNDLKKKLIKVKILKHFKRIN